MRFEGLIRFGVTAALLVCLAAPGCSSSGGGEQRPSGGTAELTGTVAQGAVAGACVFADHANGPQANNRMDDDEAASSTTTDDNGRFAMTVPGYDYVWETQGGTDRISGKSAMRMLAPSGAAKVGSETDDPLQAVSLGPFGKSFDQAVGCLRSFNTIPLVQENKCGSVWGLCIRTVQF